MRLVAMPVTKNGYVVPELVSLTALLKLTKAPKSNNYGKHYSVVSVIPLAQYAGTQSLPEMLVPDLWVLTIEIGKEYN
jgi:hypothetical protein